MTKINGKEDVNEINIANTTANIKVIFSPYKIMMKINMGKKILKALIG